MMNFKDDYDATTENHLTNRDTTLELKVYLLKAWKKHSMDYYNWEVEFPVSARFSCWMRQAESESSPAYFISSIVEKWVSDCLGCNPDSLEVTIDKGKADDDGDCGYILRCYRHCAV